MDEKEYNKLLKEIDRENKRINDPLTDKAQKEVSRQNIAKYQEQVKEYKPKSKEQSKNHLQTAMEGARENSLKAMAAYTPNMGSTKDASLAGNPDVLEAEEKRNEAKMADARNSANNAAVEEAEQGVQEAVNKAKDPVPETPELDETDEESAQAQSDIEEAVVTANESGQPTTPQTILTNVADKYGFGLLKFDENGQIIVPDIEEESQWKRSDTAGKLAMVGTVLSCIVSALSGGNIPPINFNKIMGVDKQYTTYLTNVHQFNEALASGVKKESENVADADYASYMESLQPEEKKTLQDITSDYEYTKSMADQERLRTQGQVSKELIEAQAQTAVYTLKALEKAVKEGKITPETFDSWLKYNRASMGEWSGPLERAAGLKPSANVTTPAGVGVGVGLGK